MSRREPEYLSYIRQLPCIVCAITPKTEQTTRTEAHHHGPRGFSQRVPDSQAIPLCMSHHRTGRDAVHQLGRRFAEHHGLDIPLVIETLRRIYLERAA